MKTEDVIDNTGVQIGISLTVFVSLFFGLVWAYPFLCWCGEHLGVILLTLLLSPVLIALVPSVLKGLGYVAVGVGIVCGFGLMIVVINLIESGLYFLL